MNKILTLIFVFLLLLGKTEAQPLRGRILLKDNVPAQFATVYIPSLGIGAISDTEGQYYLERPVDQDLSIEFSYIGFSTYTEKLSSILSGDSIKTICLQEQPIALSEVFVTPNGEDPASYILRRVQEQAVKKQNQMQYEASITSSFLTQDLDIIPVLVPKIVLWILKRTISMTSSGKMFEYCIKNEKIQAKGEILCHTNKGKCKYDSWRLIESTLKDDGFEKALKEETSINPFKFLYKEFLNSKKLPEGYVLKGTIEENGKIIDILCKSEGWSIVNNKSYENATYLYVVEDDWGILRKEEKGYGLTRIECRKTANGTWLPISYIDDPVVTDVSQAMKDYLKEEDSTKDMTRSERKIVERIKNIVYNNRKFQPCTTMCYTIKYKQ